MTEPSECPWLNKNKNNPILNPLNMMPEISQEKSAAQQGPLSTVRVQSSIPKTSGAKYEGGDLSGSHSVAATDSSVWTYPSPQQFYNALLRRNKTAEEDMMEDVVHVHNSVNEESWKQVLAWEEMHAKACVKPSLQRFVGKSEEPSLKARFNQVLADVGLSKEELFDRHDWFVDRCGTKSVRYIIDYYDTSNVPGSDPHAVNVRIDTRPAVDSIGAAWDRIRKPFWDFYRNLFHWDTKLNPLAASERTQHAIAGEAAVGLSRLTANQAQLLEPGMFVLSYIKKMNAFAQKAELTRRILERYLVGTDVDRIEPIFVPATPMAYSTYSFPSQDPSVLKAEHLPYDLNDWKLRMNQWRVPQKTASFDHHSTLFAPLPNRGVSIKNFI